jgi:hypothetical protein
VSAQQALVSAQNALDVARAFVVQQHQVLARAQQRAEDTGTHLSDHRLPPKHPRARPGCGLPVSPIHRWREVCVRDTSCFGWIALFVHLYFCRHCVCAHARDVPPPGARWAAPPTSWRPRWPRCAMASTLGSCSSALSLNPCVLLSRATLVGMRSPPSSRLCGALMVRLLVCCHAARARMCNLMPSMPRVTSCLHVHVHAPPAPVLRWTTRWWLSDVGSCVVRTAGFDVGL